jgi:small conductance mechanosensitive channel
MEDNKAASAITTVTESKSLVQTLSDSINSFKNGDISQGTSTLIQEIVIPAGIGLLGLMAVYFVSKMIARRVSSVICGRVDETLGKFIGKMMFYSIMIIACVTILAHVGFEVSGFMAVLATAGFAIGLAFQGTLSNFSAGILLLVFRPFKVGDTVNIANVMGKVNEIDIFTTTLDTPDNRRLIIPNSTIASSTIENISFHPHRRVEVIVGVEYGANAEQTRLALTAAVESMTDMIIPGEGRGHQIILSNLGPSSVDWTVRVWVAKENFFIAKERITSQIKLSLGQHKIAIPFPQLHLHMSPQAVKTIEDGESRSDSPSLSMPTIHSASSTRVRPRARGDAADRSNQAF